MTIQQISVFLENNPGSMARLTRLLADNKINLIALSLADTAQYGLLRVITSNTELAAAALREAGYSARTTDVIAVCVDDKPGGLAGILDLISAAGLSVEYLYSVLRSNVEGALMIFHLDDPAKGVEVLREAGIDMLSLAQVQAL